MKREIMTTGDGSKTIHMPDLNEQYHSKHGALQEARHVFIEMGLSHLLQQTDLKTPVSILEYGFGTGLNALLTSIAAQDLPVNYTAVEAFPVTLEEVAAMAYGALLDKKELYASLHKASWEKEVTITPLFSILKRNLKFQEVNYSNQFDLIYFDAFGPRTQPELWEQHIFEQAYRSLKKNGILVTYCAAGHVRRTLQSVGFTVERLPGPPGKREMLRGTKA